ncbi:hypothetical protein B0H34DRAFT_800349 [Crassisporium funariophilum]|nr:hypothetical protein B0H34DRAFT_800349 [Crassisporium funariophilum]
MQRPSFLQRGEDPLVALCHHFNLHPTTVDGVTVGPTFDMQVLRDAHMPTHVLAVVQPDWHTSSPPLMLPIDAARFAHGFRVELNLPSPLPGTPAPIPQTVTMNGAAGNDPHQVLIVRLPVVPITVPHVSSLPLLLLYGMGLETQHNLLAWSLLPVNVVEEFPNAAAMALILSRMRDDRFERTYRHNQGIWKNGLSLGLHENRILELVQTAWNVTAEARRIRQRAVSRT